MVPAARCCSRPSAFVGHGICLGQQRPGQGSITGQRQSVFTNIRAQQLIDTEHIFPQLAKLSSTMQFDASVSSI